MVGGVEWSSLTWMAGTEKASRGLGGYSSGWSGVVFVGERFLRWMSRFVEDVDTRSVASLVCVTGC